ncbi:unnamed protein product [Rotaria sp. Silwood1]|nr:unnamed protein product [Rotaria sp. Silwood1]
MIAFGIRRSDDDKNKELQKSIDKNLPIANNQKFFLLSNEDSNRFNNGQIQNLQKNTRILLLPLIIRMLLKRIAERTNIIEKFNNSQTSNEIKRKLNINRLLENKQYNFYKNFKELINTNCDNIKVEKVTIIIFFIMSFVVFLTTTFLIIYRLRDTHKKFNVIRFSSSSANNKKNHEETIKLLS